jgi:hypothetical protein
VLAVSAAAAGAPTPLAHVARASRPHLGAARHAERGVDLAAGEDLQQLSTGAGVAWDRLGGLGDHGGVVCGDVDGDGVVGRDG